MTDLLQLAPSLGETVRQSVFISGFACTIAAIMLTRIGWQGRRADDEALKARLGGLSSRHQQIRSLDQASSDSLKLI